MNTETTYNPSTNRLQMEKVIRTRQAQRIPRSTDRFVKLVKALDRSALSNFLSLFKIARTIFPGWKESDQIWGLVRRETKSDELMMPTHIWMNSGGKDQRESLMVLLAWHRHAVDHVEMQGTKTEFFGLLVIKMPDGSHRAINVESGEEFSFNTQPEVSIPQKQEAA